MNARSLRAYVPAVLILVVAGGTLWAAGPSASDHASPATLARQLVQRAGIRRGVCCVLGVNDGRLPLEIVRASGLRVHALDPRAEAVAAAQQTVDRDGLWCRRVVVETGPPGKLPYADNTIDVVVAARLTGRSLKDVSIREILRVLRPGGRAMLGRPKSAAGGKLTAAQLRDGLKPPAGVACRISDDRRGTWGEIVKPVPPGMDDWSHWNHEPDNNTVSTDRLIKAPYMTQWYGLPYYVAMPVTTVAAGGRVFTATGHIAHHRREWVTLNMLLARNGFNGEVLWRRKLPDGYMVHRSAFIATDDAFYLIDGARCLVLDPETGRETGEIRIPKLKEQWEWMALRDGKLYVLSGKGSAVEMTRRTRQHTHWSWRDLSKGYYTKRVPWGFGRTLTAYDMKARRVAWTWREEKDVDSRAMAIGGDGLYFYCPDSHIGCLDADNGSLRWANRDPNTLKLIEQPGKGLTSTPGFKSSCFAFYTPKALLFEAQTRMNLVVVSPADGKLMWHKRKVTNNPNPIYVDGKVVLGIGPGGRHVVLDPPTGKVLKNLGFAKRSCVRLTATTDSFFVRGEGLLRYDRPSGKVLVNGAVRAGCNDGAIPANGLLYLGPWLCDCNLSLMGTLAFCSAGDFRFDHVAKESEHLRVAKGVSRRRPLEVGEKDWPTYRADSHRAGASSAAVPDKAVQRWRFRPPAANTPTAPTAAAGLIFLAGQDGKVRAIDAATGKRRWAFRTAGAILMPPTVWNGRAYVGSGDGHVYALEAATGRMLWRFRAAPVERRIMLYGALGSTWPVNTGVLVDNGVAYFAAGVIDTDGTYVYALDAETGRIQWQNHSSGHLNAELRKGVSAQGTLTIARERLLMAGGNLICPGAYDRQTGKCLSAAPQNGLPRTNRGQDVCVFADRYVLFGGRLLYSAVERVVSPATFDVQGPKARTRLLSGRIPPAWNTRTFVYVHGPQGKLICCDRDKMVEALGRGDPPPPADPRRRRRVRPWAIARLKKDERRWTAEDLGAGNVLSLALASNAAVAVCRTQSVAETKPRWAVVALGEKDGKVLWRHPLPSRPLPGGLAVDRRGQTIVACQNGEVVCFGAPRGG